MVPGWRDEIRDELRDCVLAHGPLSARQLATMLGVSERTAVGYIALLAADGELTIERISLPSTPSGHIHDCEC